MILSPMREDDIGTVLTQEIDEPTQVFVVLRRRFLFQINVINYG
jgi:hypothetical protein